MRPRRQRLSVVSHSHSVHILPSCRQSVRRPTAALPLPYSSSSSLSHTRMNMGKMPSSSRLAIHVRTAISSDGCSIYADAVGDARKPALVFIHGYTLCAAVWDDIFADSRYSEQFFLVCLLLRLSLACCCSSSEWSLSAFDSQVRYDVRGHGRSGKPSEMEGYSSKLYADDFAAVCAAFGIQRPIVVPWCVNPRALTR